MKRIFSLITFCIFAAALILLLFFKLLTLDCKKIDRFFSFHSLSYGKLIYNTKNFLFSKEYLVWNSENALMHLPPCEVAAKNTFTVVYCMSQEPIKRDLCVRRRLGVCPAWLDVKPPMACFLKFTWSEISHYRNTTTFVLRWPCSINNTNIYRNPPIGGSRMLNGCGQNIDHYYIGSAILPIWPDDNQISLHLWMSLNYTPHQMVDITELYACSIYRSLNI